MKEFFSEQNQKSEMLVPKRKNSMKIEHEFMENHIVYTR